MKLSGTPVQNASVLIRPISRWVPINLRDLWEYRELLYFLTWRDIKVRYKQTALGMVWVVLQPLLLMLVFTMFFGRLVELPSEAIAYPVFTYTALVPWQLFSRALNEGSMSLIAHEKVITKTYFPRILLPASAVFASLIDFGIAFLVLIGFILFYGAHLGFAIFTLPVFVLLLLMAAFGVSLWLAAFNVLYRDVRYVLPFLTQIWMFATPIIYPVSAVPDSWRLLYSLNPMVGVVEGFRWALLGNSSGMDAMVGLSALVVAGVLGGGILYFQSVQQTFADVI